MSLEENIYNEIPCVYCIMDRKGKFLNDVFTYVYKRYVRNVSKSLKRYFRFVDNINLSKQQ